MRAQKSKLYVVLQLTLYFGMEVFLISERLEQKD